MHVLIELFLILFMSELSYQLVEKPMRYFMLTKDEIEHNSECFKTQMAKFIDFSDGRAIMINNAEWLLLLN